MKILKMSTLVLFAGLWFSCSEKLDDLTKPIEGLGGVTVPKTNLDSVLYEMYTKPYNINVRYRWSAGEMTLSNVVPAEEDRVLPVMNVLKKGWIEPFTEVAGEQFVKTYVPKEYLLVGSYVYLSNGNIVLGSAAHGLAITINGVNQIDWTSDAQIRRVMGTVHHELAHVLHQNKMYPVDYELVSAGDYQSAWSSVSTETANSLGFMSPYGSSTPNEDFATMVASLLSNGQDGFDNIVASIASEEGRRRIRSKETIIVNYFMQAYDIDFRALQAKTRRARLLLQGINDELLEEVRPVIEGKFISILESDRRVSVSFNVDSRTISLVRVDENNNRVTFSTSFTMDETGFLLASPITFNGIEYTRIGWDSALQQLYIGEGENRVYFELSNTPTILPITPSYANTIPDALPVFRVSPLTTALQYEPFKSLLDIDINLVQANNRAYNFFYINFANNAADPEGVIRLYVRTTGTGGYYTGWYSYNMNWIDRDEGTFELVHYSQLSGMAALTQSYSASLREFLTSNTFRIGYLDLPDIQGNPVVGIISNENPDYFIYGVVGSAFGSLP